MFSTPRESLPQCSSPAAQNWKGGEQVQVQQSGQAQSRCGSGTCFDGCVLFKREGLIVEGVSDGCGSSLGALRSTNAPTWRYRSRRSEAEMSQCRCSLISASVRGAVRWGARVGARW